MHHTGQSVSHVIDQVHRIHFLGKKGEFTVE